MEKSSCDENIKLSWPIAMMPIDCTVHGAAEIMARGDCARNTSGRTKATPGHTKATPGRASLIAGRAKMVRGVHKPEYKYQLRLRFIHQYQEFQWHVHVLAR